MAYIREAPTWRRRRHRRHLITLAAVLVLLLAAGVVAAGYYTGRLGSSGDGATVRPRPSCPPASARPARPAATLSPSRVRVNVYNATTVNGLAARVATGLRQRAFRVGAVANDPRGTHPAGTAVVRYGAKGTAAARLVGNQVPRSTLQRDRRRSATVDLVLGRAFTALAPPARRSATPRATACTPSASPAATTPRR
jgi:LytR cell envelope-related transcriptional attenuator